MLNSRKSYNTSREIARLWRQGIVLAAIFVILALMQTTPALDMVWGQYEAGRVGLVNSASRVHEPGNLELLEGVVNK